MEKWHRSTVGWKSMATFFLSGTVTWRPSTMAVKQKGHVQAGFIPWTPPLTTRYQSSLLTSLFCIYSGPQFQVTVYHDKAIEQQELEAGSHTQPIVQKQKYECACIAHILPFIQLRLLAQGRILPTLSRSSHLDLIHSISTGMPRGYNCGHSGSHQVHN